jgi:hypothetical protein
MGDKLMRIISFLLKPYVLAATCIEIIGLVSSAILIIIILLSTSALGSFIIEFTTGKSLGPQHIPTSSALGALIVLPMATMFFVQKYFMRHKTLLFCNKPFLNIMILTNLLWIYVTVRLFYETVVMGDIPDSWGPYTLAIMSVGAIVICISNIPPLLGHLVMMTKSGRENIQEFLEENKAIM